MTERTFRSPSPGASQDVRERPASSHGPYPRLDQTDAPPVPALPKDYVSPPQKPKVRPASLDPPQRIKSPPPKQLGGRASNSNIKKKSDSMGDLERVGSRSPVNFSRPMSPENALPKSPLAGGRVQSPTPKMSHAGVPLADEGQKQDLTSPQDVAPVVIKKKKKKQTAQTPVESSDLATKTQENRDPSASNLISQQAALPTPSIQSTSSIQESENVVKAPSVKKKKKKTVQTTENKIGADSFGAAYPSDTDSVVSERSSTTDRPRYYNTRAAGLLAKQPSIVREDREGEEEAEEGIQGTEPSSVTTSNGTSTAKTPPPTSIKSGSKGRPHGRSASQQVTGQAPKLDVPGAIRHSSLSPGRTAHFSVQPVNEGKKHQPPGRSVSPAKSALKTSPSRGHSPMVTRRGLAPSDASDTASQYSDDGSKSSIRKKAARVSFDEDPVVVGRAASPPSIPGSPHIMSPQNKSAKTRSWIDLVREQNQESIGPDPEDDSSIKPTPALPSFGSVRGRENRTTGEAVKQHDDSKDQPKTTLRKSDASADNAIGSIIAADASTRDGDSSRLPEKPHSNDPLPPEVTTVEGSGYHSEDGDLIDQEDKKSKIPQLPISTSQPSDQVSQSEPESSIVEQSGALVPHIAVQPATPGLEPAVVKRDSWIDMPGGFPSQKENESKPTPTAGSAEHQMSAMVGDTKSEPANVVGTTPSPSSTVGEVAELPRTQIGAISEDESEDSDAGSVYSDAAEDQSDPEGDGFGSINAIVESPTSPNMGLVDSSPPASPPRDSREIRAQRSATERKENEPSEPATSEGWDRAQAYWSGLSQTRKQQLEQAALPGAIDEPVLRNRSMRGSDAVNKKKKKKSKKPQPQPLGSSESLPITSVVTPSQNNVARSSSPQTALAPHLRSSMRNEPRKSALKSNDNRKSVDPPPSPKAALQKKIRPTSAAAMVDYSKSAQAFSTKSAKRISSAGPASSGTPIPAQQQKHFPVAKPKTNRDNSDSDSSFKKVRPKSVDGQKYTMRRSMRSQSSDTGPNRAGSMAARNSSPAESNVRRAFSQAGPNGAVGLRTSMRGPIDASKPARTSLRTSVESGKASRTKSPSRFSFLGSSKTKPVATESTATPAFSSRFADSSDEDDFPATTRSRFADSSDDDGPAKLTPVRGIPRRTNEGDSTDLDDSSEDKVPPPTKTEPNVNGSSKLQNATWICSRRCRACGWLIAHPAWCAISDGSNGYGSTRQKDRGGGEEEEIFFWKSKWKKA